MRVRLLAFVALFLLGFLTACSTMHLPNTGFEDSIAIPPEQGKITFGPGNTQSLNFNDFENSEDKNSITYAQAGSFILGGAIGLAKNFDVSVASYSIIPFPSLVGLKYQFYNPEDASNPLAASVAIKYGYSTFGNRGGYSPIGGTCGDNGRNCWGDPDGRWITGSLSA
jgi:hypothetical protein